MKIFFKETLRNYNAIPKLEETQAEEEGPGRPLNTQWSAHLGAGLAQHADVFGLALNV